jgi:hypothetical protein
LSAWVSYEDSFVRKLDRADWILRSEDYPTALFRKATDLGIPLQALYLTSTTVGFKAVKTLGMPRGSDAGRRPGRSASRRPLRRGPSPL